MSGRERVSSGLKTLSGMKPYVFDRVAIRGRRWRGSVFPISRLDPGKWSTKCARDCSGSSISHKFTKKLTGSDHFLKMGSRKCARDCSKSSISHTNRQELPTPEHFWTMRSTKCARDWRESSRYSSARHAPGQKFRKRDMAYRSSW